MFNTFKKTLSLRKTKNKKLSKEKVCVDVSTC